MTTQILHSHTVASWSHRELVASQVLLAADAIQPVAALANTGAGARGNAQQERRAEQDVVRFRHLISEARWMDARCARAQRQRSVGQIQEASRLGVKH